MPVAARTTTPLPRRTISPSRTISPCKELLEEAADAAPEQDNFTQQDKVAKTTEEQITKHKTQEFQCGAIADDRDEVRLRRRERGRARTRSRSTSSKSSSPFKRARKPKAAATTYGEEKKEGWYWKKDSWWR